MRRLTSCGSRASGPNPAVHRRSVPFFGIRRYLAQCCLGRSQARFAVATSTDVAGAFSFARGAGTERWCIAEALVR
jgi:hypothetical protein